MRLRRPIRAACLAAGCALAVAATLGGGAAPADAVAPVGVVAATPVALTDELITRILAVAAEQKAASADMHDRARKGQSDAHAHAVYTRRIDVVLRANGFASESEAEILRAVLVQTYNRFDKATGTYHDPEAALERRIAEIEADQSIPAASRAQIVTSLKQTLEMHRAMGVTPANVEAVRRNLPRIREALGF